MSSASLFKKKDVDMTVGSIPKLIFGFFLPMVLGLFLQQLYHAVDMIIVGQFCTYQEMSAVGGVGSITNTFVLFCSGIAIGAGVVISQYYGKHDGENLKKSVSSSVVISIILSALMTVLGMALSRPLLVMMKSNPDVIEHATLYLLVYFGGVSSIILYNMLSSILRAVGDSTRPLIYLAISSAVNIVLDLVFVAVFRWGVVGAAIATIIAQFVSAGCAFFYLAKSDKDYRIDLKNLKLDKKIGKTIILIGLPTGIQSSITGISNTFIHSYINVFGTSFEGGYAVYIKLDHLVTVFATSFGYALTSFVGQNVGANNINRACKGTNFTVIMSSIIIFLVSLPMVIFSEAVTSLFTHDASVTQAAAYIITMITPFHVISSIHTCYMSALRGYKKTRTSMFIVLSSFVAFRQIYLFIVSKILVGNLIAVLLAFPLGWALSAILHAICWFNCPVSKANRILKKHPEASHLNPEELVSWKKQGYPPLATQQVA